MAAGHTVDTIKGALVADAPLWSDAAFLQPALEDDPLLFDFEDALEAHAEAQPDCGEAKAPSAQRAAPNAQLENGMLKQQVEQLQERVAQMSALMQRMVLGGDAVIPADRPEEKKQAIADADYFSGCKHMDEGLPGKAYACGTALRWYRGHPKERILQDFPKAGSYFWMRAVCA